MQTIIRRTRIVVCLFIGFVFTACSTDEISNSTPISQDKICVVSEPLWLKHPADTALSNEPAPGYYFVNQDRSIWASARWPVEGEIYLRAGEEGNKVGWFRPAGALLEISGRRLDGQAASLEARIPCCYPTRFQATRLMFPAEGCWNVTARAADKELSFVVNVGLDSTSSVGSSTLRSLPMGYVPI